MRRSIVLIAAGAILAVPAGTAPASSPPCSLAIGCAFQVTAFKAEMTLHWHWSVSNQPNNSGWENEQGSGTFEETMKPHPLSHNGLKGDGVFIVHGKVVEGTINAPRVDTYDTQSVDRTKQHPPVTCTNHGREGLVGSGISIDSAGAASGTVAVHWELNMQETGEHEDCVSTIASLLGSVDLEHKLFTTKVAVGELKTPMVHLAGHGSAPVKLDKSTTSPGGTGFTSGGSVIWSAQITLKALPQF